MGVRVAALSDLIGFLQAVAPEKATELTKERLQMVGMLAKAHRALRATLMFHDASPWTDERRKDWHKMTGETEATTKVLCDLIRKVLGEELP